MKIAFAVLFIVVTFAGGSHAQSVNITARKVTYKRAGDVADHKREFEVIYPVISSRNGSHVRRKILSNIDYWKVFDWSGNDFSLTSEIEDGGWITNLYFDVKYNANNLLDIWLMMDGVGAYPDTATRHIVIDLRTGKKLKISDLFKRSKLVLLRNAIRRKMKESEARLEGSEKEVLKFERENGIYNDYHPSPENLQLKDLDGFSISNKGVTFLYDYGYPHVSQAIEPSGEFFMSFRQLKPFIRRDGLLARFIR